MTYEENKGSHPFLQAANLNGMALPVTGGYVGRADDKRIVGHLRMAKVAAGLQDVNAMLGISDDYDFFTAAEFISVNPEQPSIFQNWVETNVPFGTPMNVLGLGRFPMPMEIKSTAFTEAVGYVHDDKFVGVMRLELSFRFSRLTQQTRMILSRPVRRHTRPSRDERRGTIRDRTPARYLTASLEPAQPPRAQR